MFESDARCSCGGHLAYHRRHKFGGYDTGHMEGRCTECGQWNIYDKLTDHDWPKIKKGWKRGQAIDPKIARKVFARKVFGA